MFKRKEYLIIFFIKITEVLGFSLILPFLPIFAKELGASPFEIGLIMSAFSLFQFISAPIFGKLSDIYGRRPFLIISQFSTFISFIILGFADSVFLILLSRIVDGLLGSNMTIAQAYISDISTSKERSKAFASTGIAFSLGFLVGPALGGFLSQFGYGLPSFLAAGITLITIFATFLFLPETVEKVNQKSFKIEIIKIKDFVQLFSTFKTSLKLLQFITYLFAHLILVSSFALFAQKQLSLDTRQIGYSLTYIGGLNAIFRGILMNKLIDKVGEGKLRFFGIISMIIGFIIFIFTFSWIHLILAMSFFAIGTGMVRPLTLGSISRSFELDKQGAVMGVTNALGSIVQIIAPLIAGFVIDKFKPNYIGLVSLIIVILTLILLIVEFFYKEVKFKRNPS